jgi:hypothetical protein
MLAHLNAALDDWQAQALAKLARPVGPALPFAIPQATANRWAQMLSNELRQAVGESALATNRRLSDHATQRGLVANDVGAAVRSARAALDHQPASSIPQPVRSPEPRPAMPASTSQRASTQADQAKSKRVLDRQKQLPRPPLSISQQMAQLYRGTIAGDDYRRQKRSTDHDAWAMVPDDLKGALEEYWRGENLTRHEVQRLMPVYRQYVAQTDYPGDMLQWITATLKQDRYQPRSAGARAHASR